MGLIDIFKVIVIFAILDGIKYFFKNLIGEAPKRKHERTIEEIKALKAYELQVDSFYRNISSEVVSSLLEKWYLLAFDNEKILSKDKDKNLKTIKKITNDTIAYGSKETIRRLAAFQNFNYKNLLISKKNGKFDENTFVGMFLISYVISSLKKDFTGEGINPDDLLKIKLNDYDKNEKFLLDAHKEAKEILGIKP